MLKVLNIIASVNPKQGGPVEGIRQQAFHRSRSRFIEHVVTLDSPDEPYVAEFPLPVHACGRRREKSAVRDLLPWRRYRYQPDFIPWLDAHIAEYDLAVVHGLWNYSTFGARTVLLRNAVPFVVFVHGMLDPWFNRTAPVKAAAKQLFWRFNEGPLVNNAQLVLFTSEEERQLARTAFHPYRARERTVGYGTSDPAIDREVAETAFRAALPNLRKPYLLFLSRIHPKKGCDLLIEAFASMAGAYPDLDIVMAGPAQDGWDRALKQLAADKGIAGRIHWPGMLAGPAKWGAYLGAEAFVLPSHQENFGIVVAEAMVCGRPVLITDKVNIWPEVKSCGGGLVDTDDVAGVTRLLAGFLKMPPDRRRLMAERARAGFLAHFDIKSAVASIDAALMEAAAGTGHPRPGVRAGE